VSRFLKKVALACLGGLAVGLARAQTPDSVATKMPAAGRWIVKFAPFFLADPEPTVQLGVEYVLNTRWSWQVEAGYGAFRFNEMYYNERRMRGPFATWRARLEARHYFERPTSRHYRPAPYGSYFGWELFYKQVDMPLQLEVDRGAYFEALAYDARRWVGGFHFKIGGQERLGKHWVIDGYSGLGWRYIRVEAPGQPDLLNRGQAFDFEDREPTWPFITPMIAVLPSFTMNVKIGFIL
jgi:hypothetical protein